MLRKVLGVIAGMIAAIIAISIAQASMLLVITPPSPETMANPAAMQQFVAGMPTSAYLLLIAGYVLGSFAGGFVATKVAGKGEAGFIPTLVIGCLLTVAGIINFFVTMPGQPLWVAIVSILLYIPVALFGYRAARS